jgi:hypothetical protein
VCSSDLERAALATSRPAASSAIAAMDKLVAAAETELNRQLSQAGGAGSNSNNQGGQSQSNGQSGQSGKPGQSGNSQSGNH